MDFFEMLTRSGVYDASTFMSFLLVAVSICALITSLVVEGLKSIKAVDKLPTKLVAYAVAMIITPSAYIACMAYLHRPVEWFAVFGTFLAAFLVAKVSMGGWDDVTEIWQRCRNRKG